jgi:flagellar protein FlbD
VATTGKDRQLMIVVTRFHGRSLALNSDLIECAEATPDTVLTLVDGTRYVIRETLDEVVDKVREFRASVVTRAHVLEQEAASDPPLRLVPDPDREA